MKSLPLPDQRFLDAAEGWLGLGDHLAAAEELAQISPLFRDRPEVLEVQLQIYVKAGKWEECIHLASALVLATPENDHVWIQRSFALHELKRTRAAYELLMPAATKFKRNWVIPYNLACYCAQLHRLDEAEQWLKQALALDKITVKAEAVGDPDLIPLRDKIATI